MEIKNNKLIDNRKPIFVEPGEIEVRPIPGYRKYYISDSGWVWSTIGKQQWIQPNYDNKGYLFVNIGPRNVRARPMLKIHRLVAMSWGIPNPENKPCVDHINGVKTYNRPENLRWCTMQENLRNVSARVGFSSKHKGVSFDSQRNLWAANITLNGKQIYLGRFIDDTEAARAYDIAAVKHFGEFARLNFPIKENAA